MTKFFNHLVLTAFEAIKLLGINMLSMVFLVFLSTLLFGSEGFLASFPRTFDCVFIKSSRFLENVFTELLLGVGRLSKPVMGE